MKVDVLEKEDNKALLHVKDTTPHYLNTLRRLAINEVPVLAVEDVEFRQNSSILYDEILAHRLGMIPLTTDMESYDLPEEAGSKAESEVTLTLKAEAGEEEKKMVYAKDIKSDDKEVQPVHEDIPIVKLHPGQEVECEMTAVMGQGKEHSKWSPCTAWFKYYPHVEVKKQPDNAEELADKYSPALEFKNGKLKVNEEGLHKHDVIDEDVEEETDGAITYEEEDDFLFFIESWGQMDIETLVGEALRIHNEQLDDFKKKIEDA